MAFPQVASSASNETAAGTSHVVTMPASIVAGRVLISINAANDGNDNDVTITPPGDWTQLFTQKVGSFDTRWSAFYKFAAGGDSLTLTTNRSVGMAHIVYQFSGAHASTPPAVGTAATGSSTTPDPPSLNPADWDIEDTTWIACCATNDQSGTVNGYPSGYTSNQITITNTSDASVGAATKESAAASEDPGTFSLDASDNWGAQTIAIRPAAVAAAASDDKGVRVPASYVTSPLRSILRRYSG